MTLASLNSTHKRLYLNYQLGIVMPATSKTTPVRFHFFSLKFTPYKNKENTHNSTSILKDIITHLSNEKLKKKAHLIDRNQNRENESPRELFMTSAVFIPRVSRIRCSIALFRSGRKPLLKPADKFKLIPLDVLGSIAEQTHFFIDYSGPFPLVCVEYNYHAPRISDIEYYFRNIARDTLNLSRVTEVTTYMDSSLDETLADLRNVLSFEVKAQPSNLSHLDLDIRNKYFSSITSLGAQLKPKFVKVEALFQTPGSSKPVPVNNEANNMINVLLRKFKARSFNVDSFENFVVKYESNSGEEKIFNLLKGKKEIIKEIDLEKVTRNRDWYDLIEGDFDSFISWLRKGT